MLTLFVVRHGSTAWNDQDLMQGRRDVPLSARGRAEAAGWRLPADIPNGIEWVSSPLRRATETATILAGSPPRIEPALVEMDWGDWEGFRLDELASRHGEAFRVNERRGLDFRPQRGESPREVLARVGTWLDERARNGRSALVVTHKGVLRVMLVAATGWDMTGKPPIRLEPACLHEFALDGAGLSVVRCNVPLAAHANQAL